MVLGVGEGHHDEQEPVYDQTEQHFHPHQVETDIPSPRSHLFAPVVSMVRGMRRVVPSRSIPTTWRLRMKECKLLHLHIKTRRKMLRGAQTMRRAETQALHHAGWCVGKESWLHPKQHS